MKVSVRDEFMAYRLRFTGLSFKDSWLGIKCHGLRFVMKSVTPKSRVKGEVLRFTV